MAAPAKQRRLAYEDQKIVEELIREHCDVIEGKGDTKIVRYHAGWNDDRVTKQVAQELEWPTLHAQMIKRFRDKHVGKLVGWRDSGLGNPILRVALHARNMALNLEPRTAELEEMMRRLYADKGWGLPTGFGEPVDAPAFTVAMGEDEEPEPVVAPLRVKR